MTEGVVARKVEHIQYLLHTTAGVHADRQVMLLRFLVHWKKIRMVERIFALDAAKEDAHRAVLFGKANFIEGNVHRLKWQHRHPFYPLRGLAAGPGEKAVVGAAQRNF